MSDNSNEVLKFINVDIKKQFRDFIEDNEYYYDNAEKICGISSDIAGRTEELDKAIKEIYNMVQVMANNSEESRRNSNQILSDIKETSCSMSEVAATAESQANLAQKLNELIEGFKI
ncbi:MAG: hypothetical protein PUE01_03905 [Clostridiaceae bacterium]|nr:hypothetical protein [Clostridiaceae bacterium]